MFYVISYDLRLPGRDYETLYQALRNMGAKPALQSVWAVTSGKTAKALRDQLKAYIDSNDRLLVAKVTEWATFNAMVDLNKV